MTLYRFHQPAKQKSDQCPASLANPTALPLRRGLSIQPSAAELAKQQAVSAQTFSHHMLLAKLSVVALTGGQGRCSSCTDPPCKTDSRTSASISTMWPVSTTIAAFACTSKQCLREHEVQIMGCRTNVASIANRLVLRKHRQTSAERACSRDGATAWLSSDGLRQRRRVQL